ncbi:hypothetical protein PybrP1_002611 [[Pythium] brassicae (nom. inval.)]|nr:hypothetical protein PybrP1_002611 [[Pythium] brassicae (nom. inval.)]
MKTHTLACLLLGLLFFAYTSAVQEDQQAAAALVDSDAGLNVKQIVQKRGYAIEEHKVVTADRYILTMFRLPKSYDETQRNVSAAPNKPAVYLIHGLLDSSYAYVLNFRTQSLAYLLADAGYDTDNKFWDFTWEDMGKYDLPAMINYVLNAFVGFSLNQEVARRVSYFGALAPVAFLGDSTSQVFNLLAKTHVDEIVAKLGVKEFLMRNSLIQDVIGKFACAFVDEACGTFVNLLTGPSENINKTRIHVYISQTPAGTSVKNMGHYAQGIRDDTFRRYDYGCQCSKLFSINLCPKAFCKNKADLAKLRARLPAGTIVSEKSVAYGHLDYTWAFNANEVIYKDIIAQIKQFEGKGY